MPSETLDVHHAVKELGCLIGLVSSLDTHVDLIATRRARTRTSERNWKVADIWNGLVDSVGTFARVP